PPAGRAADRARRARASGHAGGRVRRSAGHLTRASGGPGTKPTPEPGRRIRPNRDAATTGSSASHPPDPRRYQRVASSGAGQGNRHLSPNRRTIGHEVNGMKQLPTRRDGVETRARLLRIARETFEEKGYHRTSIAEIRRRASVANEPFYRYFDGK